MDTSVSGYSYFPPISPSNQNLLYQIGCPRWGVLLILAGGWPGLSKAYRCHQMAGCVHNHRQVFPHHYLVRITPGHWGPRQFLRTGAQNTGQSRRLILLLGPWLRGRRSRLRKWVHSSAIRGGGIHEIQIQHPARSVPFPITTQSGGRKVAEPTVIESRGPRCKMVAEKESQL